MNGFRDGISSWSFSALIMEDVLIVGRSFSDEKKEEPQKNSILLVVVSRRCVQFTSVETIRTFLNNSPELSHVERTECLLRGSLDFLRTDSRRTDCLYIVSLDTDFLIQKKLPYYPVKPVHLDFLCTVINHHSWTFSTYRRAKKEASPIRQCFIF